MTCPGAGELGLMVLERLVRTGGGWEGLIRSGVGGEGLVRTGGGEAVSGLWRGAGGGVERGWLVIRRLLV